MSFTQSGLPVCRLLNEAETAEDVDTMGERMVREAWLKGAAGDCSPRNGMPSRPHRMVLLGAPGVGKGTQAELLCEKFKTCHLSTGEVFRTAKCLEGKELSSNMKAALAYIQRGELVPDETVIAMVRERMNCLRGEYGFLLDGFPRTVYQAEALTEILSSQNLKLDVVLDYTLPTEEVLARLSGRRTCRSCRTTFHVIHKPPKVEGICDKCGGELFQRDDDHPESILVRLEAYNRSTTPLTDYYRDRDLLLTISAEGSPQEIFTRTLAALKEKVC